MNKQEQQAPQGQQIQVKISDEILKGVYVNQVQVAHTPQEFVLDFMNIFPPAGIVSARVIMSPALFKNMAAMLADTLKKYEQQFGEIKAGESPARHIGFRTE